jgi:hypothetical protein
VPRTAARGHTAHQRQRDLRHRHASDVNEHVALPHAPAAIANVTRAIAPESYHFVIAL